MLILEEAIRSGDWVQGFGNIANPRLGKIVELYDLFQDIFEKFSNFSRILSKSNIHNEMFEDRQLSTIRNGLVHYCIELDKLLIKIDYCDSCATIKEVKTVSFKDKHDHLYTINIHLPQLKTSNEYKSITVIDNDDSICTMLRQLDMNIIKANIKSFRNNLHIIFSDFNLVQKLEIKNW